MEFRLIACRASLSLNFFICKVEITQNPPHRDAKRGNKHLDLYRMLCSEGWTHCSQGQCEQGPDLCPSPPTSEVNLTHKLAHIQDDVDTKPALCILGTC